MKTFIVKVEYRTPRGSHMKYEAEHLGSSKTEALYNAFNHLVIKCNRKIDGNVRMEAQLKVEVSDAVA